MSRLGFFRHKMGILAAFLSLAAVIAAIWFCMAGGWRQTEPEGTLVNRGTAWMEAAR